MISNPVSETAPKKKRNWFMFVGLGFGIFVLGIVGLVGLVNVAAESAPYKVKCNAQGSVYKGGFTDQTSADAAYQEKIIEGMTCSKEYSS